LFTAIRAGVPSARVMMNLSQIGLGTETELISLDGYAADYFLTPEQFTDHDVAALADGASLALPFFTDPAYLHERLAGIEGRFVHLAALRAPAPDAEAPGPGFTFAGYELLDGEMISALNFLVHTLPAAQGSSPVLFTRRDLNGHCLFGNYDQACHVQKRLPETYTGTPEAHCTLWAIWLYRP
jgi:hypothetical protein